MRKKRNNIKDRWDDTPYCLVGRNCQHFADALRNEYNRLIDPTSFNVDSLFDQIAP